MHRTPSKMEVLEAGKKTKSTGAASTSSASPAKHGGRDWVQKRTSRLLQAPQARLTEFGSRNTGRFEEGEENATSSVRISESSLSDLLPVSICRHLAENTEQVSMTPFSKQMQAACLFLDVSQFTAITERISNERGLRGPETLAAFINTLFTQLVRLVTKGGGDIFKFAGDAVIVLWPANEAENETVEMCAHRAVQCAVDVQTTMPELKLHNDAGGQVKLAFKAGVGVGMLSIVHLGGGKLAYGAFETVVDEGGVASPRPSNRDLKRPLLSSGAAIAGRREYIALGDPLRQAFSAEKLAQRNDVVVSRQAWSLVQSKYQAKKPHGGKALPDGNVLIGAQKDGMWIKKQRPREFEVPQKEWMLTYVPRSAHLFLAVEAHTRKDWVSELRRVTVLFINLGVPKAQLAKMLMHHDGMDALHAYFCSVQSAVMDYEGSINKFLMDDKGSTIIAVFGLPPISHENDATRGVLASLAISTFLQEMGAEPAVGVATGIAFCGVVGHPGGRREYTVLGDIVNLAARLMQRATEKQEGVLTDSETYYQAQEYLDFNYLKEVKVKGKSKLVDVWQPHQRGFKTKRSKIGKLLGMRKHRRRRSLDEDWREQVLNVTEHARNLLGSVSLAEVQKLKDLVEQERQLAAGETRQGDSRENNDFPGESPAASSANPSPSKPPSRPQSRIASAKHMSNAVSTKPHVHHEDERVVDSDTHDALVRVMMKMEASVLGKAPIVPGPVTVANGTQAQHSRGRPCPVVLEGSIGTGKSRLLARLSALFGTEPDIWTLEAAANPFERGALARPFGFFVTLISEALWRAHMKSDQGSHKAGTATGSFEDVPPSVRRSIIRQWLSAGTRSTAVSSNAYLLNEDFDVDFEIPEEVAHARHAAEIAAMEGKSLTDRLLESPTVATTSLRGGPLMDEALNRSLLEHKSNLIVAIFEGMCADRRVVMLIDDAMHLDASSWDVALRLAKFGPTWGCGLAVVLASRPVSEFVLIDPNSRDSYESFQRLKTVTRVIVPSLPPRSVKTLAMLELDVDAISPEIEVALEKCQGNPLFVRELVRSMIETPNVLDIDTKQRVALFGSAAQAKLHPKDAFPSCTSCGNRFPNSRSKINCLVCGRVVCLACAPTKSKRLAMGHRDPVRSCLECVRDTNRHREVTAEAIAAMGLEPPVAIVCVIGTWIDKLTTPQQMILKVACLLRRGLQFEKSQAFEAYPLDPDSSSFELEFDALIRLQFVKKSEPSDDPLNVYSKDSGEDVYEFCHNFMPDILNQRVLESQRAELQNHVNEARSRREKQMRANFMSQQNGDMSKLVLKVGYLYIHKQNVRANRHFWKQRWCVIVGHNLEMYYDRAQYQPERKQAPHLPASSCDLRQAKISIEKGTMSNRTRVFRITVPSWWKQGKLQSEKRDFFVSPELCTDHERDQWIYQMKLAIEAQSFDPSAPQPAKRKRGQSVSAYLFGTRKTVVGTKELPPPPPSPAGPPPEEFEDGGPPTPNASTPKKDSTPRKSRGLELLFRKRTGETVMNNGPGTPRSHVSLGEIPPPPTPTHDDEEDDVPDEAIKFT